MSERRKNSFNTEGSFQTEKTGPLSIETPLFNSVILSVSVQSTVFSLKCAVLDLTGFSLGNCTVL